MKSAYELAMERLEKSEPKVEVTEEMRAKLAKCDQLYQSKIAEREVFLGGLIAKAKAADSFGEEVELDEQKTREISVLQQQWNTAKEKIRKGD